MSHPAVRTEALTRTYKRPRRQRTPQTGPDLLALDHVDVEVRSGELFGLLGPNGAGKTTLIKILTTLLAPSSGQAWVDGLDIATEAQAIRPRINMVSGGETCGYGPLTVRETLWLFTQIYGVSSSVVRERIERMLDVVDLTDKADTRVSYLSTGQRQKMNFCRGFLTNPKILFLDEPTLGLDVTVARAIRRFLREWMNEQPGRTILLTTHYMMEADELCDRVAVIDQGKILACDTPLALKRGVQRFPRFDLTISPDHDGWRAVGEWPGVHHAITTAGPTSVDVKVLLEEESVIGLVVQRLVEGGSRILSLKKVEPTLEDVFIETVGHGLEPD